MPRGRGFPCSVAGCAEAAYVRGFCRAHYHRALKHGDPLAGRVLNGAPVKWLRDHAGYAGDDCLIWPFSKIRGYGSAYFEGRTQTASRVMCILAHGPAPADNMDAAHSCGNGHLGCTNPNHLRWATRSENVAEAYRHARGGARQ